MHTPPRRTSSLVAFVPVLFALALALGAGTARADLRPDGVRGAGYGFSVENTAAFPDYVFVYFPLSRSSGAPDPAFFQVADASPAYNGRWATPRLRAIKKADFDEARLAALDEAALQAFFDSDKVASADFDIQGVRWVAETSPIHGIEDVIVIDKVEGKTLTAHFGKVVYTVADGKKVSVPWVGSSRPDLTTETPAPTPAPAKTEPAPANPEPAPATPEPAPATTPTPAPADAAPPAKKSSCASGDGALAAGLIGLAVVGLARARRRLNARA